MFQGRTASEGPTPVTKMQSVSAPGDPTSAGVKKVSMEMAKYVLVCKLLRIYVKSLMEVFYIFLFYFFLFLCLFYDFAKSCNHIHTGSYTNAHTYTHTHTHTHTKCRSSIL